MTAVPDARTRMRSQSARSLLLTVLGEFVHPADAPVWTAALVDALVQLGIEEKAARQALARTAAEGLVTSERQGRRVRWTLTRAGRVLLADGTTRIYGFMQQPRRWDGRWLVLSVTVPESQRQVRHRLRTRLSWAGLGSPGPGLWVVPDAGKSEEVAAVVAELGLAADAQSWVGPTGSVGDPLRLVAAAWPLAEVEQAYGDFLREVAALSPESDASTFLAQVQLVQTWRRFPLLDPALPPELLDHDWPGPAAAHLFRTRHDAWHRAAQRHWGALTAAAAGRS